MVRSQRTSGTEKEAKKLVWIGLTASSGSLWAKVLSKGSTSCLLLCEAVRKANVVVGRGLMGEGISGVTLRRFGSYLLKSQSLQGLLPGG